MATLQLSASDAQTNPGNDVAVDLPGVRAWKLRLATPPLFLEPTDAGLRGKAERAAWIESHRTVLDKLLLEHGGIVFRDFGIRETGDFAAFVDLFEPFAGNYSGGAASRQKIAGKVFEATRASNTMKLPLHQEMAYLRDYPGHVVFFCRKPADVGGATTIADMRQFTRALPADLREKLERHGIMLVRNFAPIPADGNEVDTGHPDQRSWKFAFYTDDREQVEAECAAKDLEPIWREDGGLVVRNRLAGFTSHPRTGETLYRSAIHTNAGKQLGGSIEERESIAKILARQDYPSGFYLGDGTPLTDEELISLKRVLDEIEVRWAWKAGDVMLLDNLLTAHGRDPFDGDRDVQVSLLA